MKATCKKILCALLAVLVLLPSLGSAAAAASDYPDGFTAAEAEAAVTGTDTLLAAALPVLTGKTLSEIVLPRLYTDDNLSALVTGLYRNLEENASQLSLLGLDFGPAAVAAALGDYPAVAEVLAAASSWSAVDLTGVHWGVTGADGFATAVAKSMAPLNDVLYMLLCGGKYRVGLLTVEGGNGYETGLVPLLRALGVEDLPTQTAYTAAADEDRANMVKTVLLPVLRLIETAMDAPAAALTEILPRLALFSESGQLDASVKTILKPILEHPLVKAAEFLRIIDPDVSVDVSSILSVMADENGTGFQMAPLDTAALAACASAQGETYTVDRGRAYVCIARWLVESLKINRDNLPTLLTTAGNGTELPAESLNALLDADTDVLVAFLIRLFSPAPLPAGKALSFPSFAPQSVTYTPNLTQKDFEKVLDEIDELLDEIVVDSTGFGSVYGQLTYTLYTGDNVTAALSAVYSALEKNGLTAVLALLGFDTTPAGVAKALGSAYPAARKALAAASGWSKVGALDWGFATGSREGFQEALTAGLRPLFPLLRTLLAGEDFVLFDSVRIKGGDGYNSAVIPLLEALGCPVDSFPDYETYRKHASGDGVLSQVLDPVFGLLDTVFAKPVYTLTGLLPNILYFYNSGCLETCVDNLLLPLTAFVRELPAGTVTMPEFKLPTVAELTPMLTSRVEKAGIKLAPLDLNVFAAYGTAETCQSKRVLDGEKQTYTYIKADRTAVLITLLRFLADTLKLPENANLLTSSAGGFSEFSGSFSVDFAAMTSDELIEWLYHLLFRERATVVIEQNEEYKPVIVFKEKKPNLTWLWVVGGVAAFETVLAVILILNRKKLFPEHLEEDSENADS